MFSAVLTGAVAGIRSSMIRVEVDTAQGLPCFEMVGLLSGEVREARERVRVALKNTGFKLPAAHITVNLSPADIRKEGTAFDLPIAVGILLSQGMLPPACVSDTLVIGELGLDGDIRWVRGILPIVLKAKEQGVRRCIVPYENEVEAAMAEGIQVLGMRSLKEAIAFLRQPETHYQPDSMKGKQAWDKMVREDNGFPLDFSDIRGQEAGKRAAEVAAAGFHNLLLIGPPGAGKSMLAKRVPTILPPLSLEESLEVTSVYSIAGKLKSRQTLILERPFLNPHPTISPQALAGGGKIPNPGVISLAHRGVLFLDEFPEFSRAALEILRQPMEEGRVEIARASGAVTFPAAGMIVAAMNPCPCGFYPDMQRCGCRPYEVHKYLGRISHPVLDRMDIFAEIAGADRETLAFERQAETSAQIRDRVMGAWERQKERFQGTKCRSNADMGVRDTEKFCRLTAEGHKIMEQVFGTLGTTGRGYYKILKVARTIADLEKSETVREEHLMEAVCYRTADNKFWGKRNN